MEEAAEESPEEAFLEEEPPEEDLQEGPQADHQEDPPQSELNISYRYQEEQDKGQTEASKDRHLRNSRAIERRQKTG